MVNVPAPVCRAVKSRLKVSCAQSGPQVPESGERHLQGCYADRDGLRSRLAVLSR